MTNSTQNVLIDSFDQNRITYIGRTFSDAPEIDNEVIISKTDLNDTTLVGTYRPVIIQMV